MYAFLVLALGGKKNRASNGASCLQEGLNSLSPVGSAANSHFLIHEVQAVPASTAAVWSKHGVRAQDVHLQRQQCAVPGSSVNCSDMQLQSAVRTECIALPCLISATQIHSKHRALAAKEAGIMDVTSQVAIWQ